MALDKGLLDYPIYIQMAINLYINQKRFIYKSEMIYIQIEKRFIYKSQINLPQSELQAPKGHFLLSFVSKSASFRMLIWNDSKLSFVVENFFGTYIS
ncbi:hypothetical protein PGF_00001360 [Porphyromonas gingivalis 381]|nr:hypothetical protein PGF_00001360 [Porphyromonas gingivalis 381]SJL19159.1 hypothetical protein PGIN_3-3_00283 [Porphyromonas gingivalis]HBW77574.1 hypothetical protein [Porphyromonas gingivalis]